MGSIRSCLRGQQSMGGIRSCLPGFGGDGTDILQEFSVPHPCGLFFPSTINVSLQSPGFTCPSALCCDALDR